MDTISPEMRSKVMSAIHSRDTLPEMRVRKMLWANGYRFRVCDRHIVGHPDIVIPKCRALIEVRGCFWHQHGWEWDGRKLVQTSICPTATRQPRVLERQVPAERPPRRGAREGVDGAMLEPHRRLGVRPQD